MPRARRKKPSARKRLARKRKKKPVSVRWKKHAVLPRSWKVAVHLRRPARKNCLQSWKSVKTKNETKKSNKRIAKKKIAWRITVVDGSLVHFLKK